MDLLDQAAQQQQQHLSVTLAAITARVTNMHTSSVNPGICEDCGCVIPAQRLRVIPGATRCVSCQAAFEEED